MVIVVKNTTKKTKLQSKNTKVGLTIVIEKRCPISLFIVGLVSESPNCIKGFAQKLLAIDMSDILDRQIFGASQCIQTAIKITRFMHFTGCGSADYALIKRDCNGL